MLCENEGCYGCYVHDGCLKMEIVRKWWIPPVGKWYKVVPGISSKSHRHDFALEKRMSIGQNWRIATIRRSIPKMLSLIVTHQFQTMECRVWSVKSQV